MKWDYGLVSGRTPQELVAALKQAGAAGWEAVSMTVQEQVEPDRFVVIMKKQIA